jgi:hypothetical protein
VAIGFGGTAEGLAAQYEGYVRMKIEAGGWARETSNGVVH